MDNLCDNLIILFLCLLFAICMFMGCTRLSELRQTICLNSTETPQAYNACLELNWDDMKSRLILNEGVNKNERR